MNIEIAQIFTQIVSFLIMLWVLKRFAWKPLLKVLEDRENTIKSEFSLIEEKKSENDKLLNLYNEKLQNAGKEVKELIKEGREAGNKIAKDIEDKANEEAKKIISQTKEELQKEVFKAKVLLKDELVKMTLSATEKMMQSSVTSEKQKTLLEDFVSEEGAH